MWHMRGWCKMDLRGVRRRLVSGGERWMGSWISVEVGLGSVVWEDVDKPNR